MKVLAGDIGGTNARLAVVQVAAGVTRIVYERRFPTHGTPGLAPIVREFLAGQGRRRNTPASASLARSWTATAEPPICLGR